MMIPIGRHWILIWTILLVSLFPNSREAAVGDMKYISDDDSNLLDILDDNFDSEYDDTLEDIDFTDKDDAFEAIVDIVNEESLTPTSSTVSGDPIPTQVYTYSQSSHPYQFIGNNPYNQYCVQNPFQFYDPDDKEGRSLQSGLGWAAATAIMIFAFSNTVIVGATLVISYILYQVVIMALAVIAPGVATVFVKFMSLFSFL